MLRSRICGARTSAAKLLANRSGNFGLMTAVITPILIGSMGIAIDFAQGVQIRSELTNAADAAMFAGLRAGANAKQSGNVQWKNVAQAEATKNFRSQLSATNLVDAQLNTDFVERGTSLSGTGSYSYQQNTLFMGLLGSKAVQISNSQSVAISLDTFIDVTFIIDNSASMGIGATLDDRKIMNNANGNCAFACHQGSSTASLPFTPNYVHSIGAKLRIDVVREAMQDAVNKMTARAANPNQVRFSAYTFSHVHETLLAPETDKTKVLAAIAKLDLAKGNVSALNYGDTRITPALIKCRRNHQGARWQWHWGVDGKSQEFCRLLLRRR
jgi:Flp pilus assembly protein TadG